MTNNQYNASKPTKKRLTIIDATQTPSKTWKIEKFRIKNMHGVRGSSQDTKKVQAKISKRYWPFDNKLKTWVFGKEAVITHKKLNFDVYSGFVDHIKENRNRYVVDFYVTEVDDQ